MTKEYDLIVLGGGTGGYAAAIHASHLGMRVAVVEQCKVGGTCLHKGCIPSKALLKSAEMYRNIKNATQYGISLNNISLDFNQMQQRKNNIIETLHKGVQSLLQQANIDVYYGFGRILGPSIFSPVPGTISVEYENGEENTMLVPKHVLIATGSRPRTLKTLPFDGQSIVSSDQALEWDHLPKSVLIIGAGVIGIEWASLLTDLGVQVTVVEQENHILPGEDHSVQAEIKKQLANRGVSFNTNAITHLDTIDKRGEEVQLDIEVSEHKKTIAVEKVLVSIGREARVDQIGLHNTEIELDKGFIQTNEYYQTKENHIYAIGDCIGGKQLAHVALQEGMIAVEHIANLHPHLLENQQIPSCIYSYPEVAKIGLTEKEATEAGFTIKIGKMPFQAIGKAHVNEDQKGFLKMITDEQSEDILGIHIVGENATELIAQGALAMLTNANSWEISQTIHPHPTLSEVFNEAALAVDGLQIHG